MPEKQELTQGGPLGSLKRLRLKAYRGIDDELARQITTNAHHSDIEATYPVDAQGRFADLGAIQDWAARKDRILYSLVSSAQLLSLITFEPSSNVHPRAPITATFRRYPRLDEDLSLDPYPAEAFVQFGVLAHRDFEVTQGYRGDIVASQVTTTSTTLDGESDLELMQDMGYSTDEHQYKAPFTDMIRDGLDTRLAKHPYRREEN